MNLSLPASAVANAFRRNEVDDFHFTVADVFLDTNAADTDLCEQAGTVLDTGTGTKVGSSCAAH
jgi:hypothetical protein